MIRALLCIIAISPTAVGEDTTTRFPESGRVDVRDGLHVGEERTPDARECLTGLTWRPTAFEATFAPRNNEHGDRLLRFPSPLPSGDAENDRVAVEWYLARDEHWRPVRARAVVVVHESGRGMTVGRLVARGLAGLGHHAFLVQLPFYGERGRSGRRANASNLAKVLRQGVADVRRTRDVVAALPLVDDSHIALQGTSLGGFVAANAGSLDRGFESVHLLLAGGHLADIVENGKKDTARVRRDLAEAGFVGEKLRQLVRTVEPTRIAHRLDPNHTWLYSGERDTVVPIRNALALAKAARLPEAHHVRMSADHYSGIVLLPWVLGRISDRIAEH